MGVCLCVILNLTKSQWIITGTILQMKKMRFLYLAIEVEKGILKWQVLETS